MRQAALAATVARGSDAWKPSGMLCSSEII